MKRLFILSQSFVEKKGSFYAFVEELSRYAYKQGYDVTILCRRLKNQNKNEKLPYAKLFRYPYYNVPIVGTILSEILFGFYVNKYFHKVSLSQEDIIVANGYTPIGILNKKYFLRTPDQPVKTFLKNMRIAKNQVSLLSRMARFVQFSLSYPVDKLVVKNAAGLICSSIENRLENIKYYNVSKTPYFIPNKAVNIKEYTGAKKNKGKTILFISRADEKVRKGAIFLEKILPTVFEKYSELKLIHIGEKFRWNLPEKYNQRITSLGKIPRKKMKEYYKSTNLLILNSLNEGIPAVLIEAMAVGTPIISSDIEGIKEYLPKDVIFKRGNTKELEKKICYMLDNPLKAKKFGKLGIKKAIKLDLNKYYKNLLFFLEGKEKKINLLI